jgi:hypothetical protein
LSILDRKSVEYLKGNQKKMADRLLRRSQRIKGLKEVNEKKREKGKNEKVLLIMLQENPIQGHSKKDLGMKQILQKKMKELREERECI